MARHMLGQRRRAPADVVLADMRFRREHPHNEREVLHCNGCGRGFVHTLVFDEPAQPGAPRGICMECQDA